MVKHKIKLYGRSISAIDVFVRYFVQGKHAKWFKDHNGYGSFCANGYDYKNFSTPFSTVKGEKVIEYDLLITSTTVNNEGKLMFAKASKELLALIELEAWEEILQLIKDKKAIVVFSVYWHCGATTKKHLTTSV